MTQPDRDCDMIMKGGITSGVVYPLAATHLAQTYRFRNLGGASVGAIAAVMVAAAELGRRDGYDGFAELGKLPDQLSGNLQTLFQPAPAGKPAFTLLNTMIDRKKSRLGKGWAVVASAVRAAPVLFSISLLAAMLPGVGLAIAIAFGDDLTRILSTALLWLPLALAVAVAVALGRLALRTKRSLEDNGFGLCNGHLEGEVAHPPLTDWLTRVINRTAGRAEDGPPVTIGDLWGAAAVAAFDEQVPDGRRFLDLPPHRRRDLVARRLISLEVMTTNLTLRRPYRFPFEGREFFFCQRCLASYFPAHVVEAMTLTTVEVPDSDGPPASKGGPRRSISTMCPWHTGTRVRYFPRPPDVPLVVAARMSLSFPLLISAVPLFYIDYARAPEHVAMVPVWFSDGGIASNFPMHLFDAPWPARPTFGIDLQKVDLLHGNQQTYLPKSSALRSHAIGSLTQFGAALFDTMHNWADITQLTLPAYRGRVAEVRLSDAEGGMNLNMPAELVMTVANYGDQAAAHFDDFDLAAHLRGRFEASMAAMDNLITMLHDSAEAGFASTVEAAVPKARREAARELIALGGAWAAGTKPTHPGAQGNIPHPEGDIRIVPRQ
jgi:hypothetical protein